MRRPVLVALVAATTLAAGAIPASGAAAPRLASWAPSMTIGGPNFTNQTIRMVVHSSIAGTSPRITLSNLRGTTPLAVGAVDVAVQSTMAVTAGASWSQAMQLATEAAGIAIGKMGSVAVSLNDLQKNL